MTEVRERLPVDIRTGWVDFSPALHWYATRAIVRALQRFSSMIRRITVIVGDAKLRGEADEKLARLEIVLEPAGFLAVSAGGPNAYRSVDRAVRAARRALRAHAGRVDARDERTPELLGARSKQHSENRRVPGLTTVGSNSGWYEEAGER